eukprot:m.4785 g.4785  ORF g.4785 m.4785 type:complete len:71 (-) comp3175_c0_seq1:61-273(-)
MEAAPDDPRVLQAYVKQLLQANTDLREQQTALADQVEQLTVRLNQCRFALSLTLSGVLLAALARHLRIWP